MTGEDLTVVRGLKEGVASSALSGARDVGGGLPKDSERNRTV